MFRRENINAVGAGERAEQLVAGDRFKEREKAVEVRSCSERSGQGVKAPWRISAKVARRGASGAEACQSEPSSSERLRAPRTGSRTGPPGAAALRISDAIATGEGGATNGAARMRRTMQVRRNVAELGSGARAQRRRCRARRCR